MSAFPAPPAVKARRVLSGDPPACAQARCDRTWGRAWSTTTGVGVDLCASLEHQLDAVRWLTATRVRGFVVEPYDPHGSRL